MNIFKIATRHSIPLRCCVSCAPFAATKQHKYRTWTDTKTRHFKRPETGAGTFQSFVSARFGHIPLATKHTKQSSSNISAQQRQTAVEQTTLLLRRRAQRSLWSVGCCGAMQEKIPQYAIGGKKRDYFIFKSSSVISRLVPLLKIFEMFTVTVGIL